MARDSNLTWFVASNFRFHRHSVTLIENLKDFQRSAIILYKFNCCHKFTESNKVVSLLHGTAFNEVRTPKICYQIWKLHTIWNIGKSAAPCLASTCSILQNKLGFYFGIGKWAQLLLTQRPRLYLLELIVLFIKMLNWRTGESTQIRIH